MGQSNGSLDSRLFRLGPRRDDLVESGDLFEPSHMRLQSPLDPDIERVRLEEVRRGRHRRGRRMSSWAALRGVGARESRW